MGNWLLEKVRLFNTDNLYAKRQAAGSLAEISCFEAFIDPRASLYGYIQTDSVSLSLNEVGGLTRLSVWVRDSGTQHAIDDNPSHYSPCLVGIVHSIRYCHRLEAPFW